MCNRYLILFFVICLGYATAIAQDPVHYTIGEQKLAGINIYDLIQDDDKNLWIATNQGLYFFDGYEFSSYQNDLIQSSSIFNLRKASNGTIYFNDLKNRVFRIIDGKVELFYTLNTNESHHNTFLETYGDKVYVQANTLTIIDKDTVCYPYSFEGSRVSFRVFEDGSSFCATAKHSCLYSDGSIEQFKRDSADLGIMKPTVWIRINETEYAIDQSTMILYSYDVQTREFNEVKQLNPELKETVLRVYQVKNEIWIAGNRNGVFVYDQNWNAMNESQPMFKDQFVSDVFVDQEGNTLLSTFDNGILVVPDLMHKEYLLSNGAQIADFSFDNDSTLFIGTNAGDLIAKNIYTFQEQLLYTSYNAKPIEYLHYSEENQVLIFTSPKGFATATWTNGQFKLIEDYPGSIKSAITSQGVGYVALNRGVSRIGFSENSEIKSIGKEERAYDVAVDELTGDVFVVYSTGLNIINKEGDILELNQINETVSTVEYTNGCLYVGTSEGKVIVYCENQIVDEIHLNSSIRVLSSNDEYLFIRTLEGIYLYVLETGRLIQLSNSLGYNEIKISSGYLNDSYLFLLKSDKICIQPLERVEHDFPKLEVSIDDFYVNGMKTEQDLFDYSSSTYGVSFGVSTIRYSDNVSYRYKLEGFEDEWKSLSFSDHVVNFGFLPAGSYKFVVQSVNGDQYSEPVVYEFTIDAPYYQKLWFFLVIIVFIGLIFFLIYRARLEVIRKKNQEEVEKQRMQTDLLEMELKALRSQMNPHFIFNSLNSIQSLVLKEDIDNSYDYLVLFAKLVRNTLNYSDLNAIPMDKEIEFLEVYLSLEKLRFKKDFSYEINYDEAEDFSVPPLIIQPFLENALVHGLLHKEGHKHLEVQFSLDKNLKCTITDNGVGRKKAQEIAQRSNLNEHKSFAMKAIQQRLDLMNKSLGEEVGRFTVEDLYENGIPVGTRVELILPVEHLY